ncbi:MAG: ATP-dependent Clp protease adapter ClpS [Actinomyces urogenitalis]|jgi:ATP-dependent Clp protease adaptor protein ClpS|uniref:ATP-dependent Clp protease adapter protein ClpS n=2 Tax=Actinomyces urogenitalis TaxID=103621 RepID=C0W2H3_9ACTO|nr:ATP-dependent Clp protease adapter ClpS [Actinomyces urogenitalis]EEH67076.1 ATP-dependent Clp protease adaptor protein ClpS [Actinomyces urogenitalis DSM 15434]KGE99995.1 Clp protease ClpS [Actinomyces urogenitalis S6-C4]MBS5977848.1 ATP-dependent Clp protease adapter ClpS [Actinomyces urogenitalis]MDK8238620.1 ATP-dependent Clp protease adapter ClpS [Actinomyces urogenitalis]MDK8835948.1 ATP-dependent Clp protease adapter ClpS [Actinomyces urogenitalis]
MSASAPVASPDTREDSATQRLERWRTVVHDDPVNTMDYVVWVFRSYFRFPLSLAHQRMMQVHTTGRAIVSRGPRERMEVDVTAMHSYGLRATIEPDGEDPEGAEGEAGA